MSSGHPNFLPDETLKTLERIAEKYDEGSPERAALEVAAKGLLFIHAAEHGNTFVEYLEQFDADLTEEQRRHLTRMGLR
ncbi:hypothetical protein [Polyangium spumosum]|uniref:Uncharacterized protein n=1 Tax=Polyangium spumosum TaxID=889282 RepID=A0A6N7PLC4_9BACT|nr:hypothetical protein [Polyangium spumosum]MRG90905.1 hypothetical protein [Polyangium spumosum]